MGRWVYSRPPRCWSGVFCAAALLVAGCGGAAVSPGGRRAGEALATTTPAAASTVDEVTWNLPYGEPTSLDYVKAYNYSENTVLGNVCESLLRLTPDFRFAPGLARAWRNPTPNEWVYEVRRGVRFFNGREMTADDVVASIRRHLDPRAGSFYSLPYGEQIADVARTGPWQVTVTTKQPNLVVNEMMVTGLGAVADPDYVAQRGERYGTAAGGVMCTGPYRLARWRSGEEISLEPNPDYWDSSIRARNRRVTFTFLTDGSTLTNALLAGDVDGSYEAPVSGVTRLQNNPDLSLTLGESTQTFNLNVTDTPALRELKLRQALSLIVDRPALANTVFDGTAEPLKATTILPIPYAWGRAQLNRAYRALPDRPYDLEAARRLVAEAGKPARPIVLGLQAGDAASLQIVNAIVDGGRKIGLPIRTKQFPSSEFIALFFDPAARRQIDVMLTTGYTDVPDPIEFFELVALKGSVQNFTDFDDPVVQRDIVAARAERDVRKRARLVASASRAFEAALPIIPLLYLPERLAMSNDLTGAPAAFPYQYYPWAAGIGAAASR